MSTSNDAPAAALTPELRDRLLAALGPDRLSTDRSDLQEYGRDWTRVYPPAPSVVAFPGSTAEVSRVLAICHQAGLAVVPSGGRTGLAGGAMATRGELVLSLSRMRGIGPVDMSGATVRVEAGAVTEEVHRAAAAHGLTWPVDFASKGSSTVGGNIATNAGGVRVIRHGLTRQWVLGLEVVLADGTVIVPGGALEKNNTGLDLRQLFIGSEGTLGVITAATLKLTPLGRRPDVILLGVGGLAGVLRLFREARAGAPCPLNAFELFTDRCLARVMRHRAARPPFDGARPSHFALLELEAGGEDTPPAVLDWLGSLLERGLAEDAVIAQTPQQAADLWALREGISESLAATGLPHKNDVALPIAALEAFCADLDALFAARYPGYEVCVFGHIGDGNLHVNVMKPEATAPADFREQAAALDAAMFALVERHRGSISAEHGIGLLKKSYLGFTRSPAEIAVQAAVKRALDPRGILNPGKILDVGPPPA